MNINVQHVAKLANLSLKEDEMKKFEKQLINVLQYIEKLNEVHVIGVEPTSQVTGLENVAREDIKQTSLSQHDTISTAPSTSKGMFKVKGILTAE